MSDTEGGPRKYETKINPDDTKFHHQTKSNFMNKQRSRQRLNEGQNNGLNTNKSRFFLIQLSQDLDTNVPYDDGSGDFLLQ